MSATSAHGYDGTETDAGVTLARAPSALSQQFLLEHLAHRVAWQLIDDPHLTRPLVHRKLLGHIVDQLLRLGVTDDERDDALAQVFVGQPDHRRLGHAGMPEQHRLDFAGPDPVATGLDQVDRLAADDAMHTRRCR